ncbi:hypothetical protein KGF54_001473 [Candida jiufengensis]|uniref:uncharacterized protein n=1 Tax=Candida jiufengensis TaxID=497108 RepID=UPI0022247B57|nr:uncharacterized protein KGF54_001473 [Candida jiufengensis]KAI5954912.1 hypothetical protein KGF54_001473 [Candida jiufengensis]
MVKKKHNTTTSRITKPQKFSKLIPKNSSATASTNNQTNIHSKNDLTILRERIIDIFKEKDDEMINDYNNNNKKKNINNNDDNSINNNDDNNIKNNDDNNINNNDDNNINSNSQINGDKDKQLQQQQQQQQQQTAIYEESSLSPVPESLSECNYAFKAVSSTTQQDETTSPKTNKPFLNETTSPKTNKPILNETTSPKTNKSTLNTKFQTINDKSTNLRILNNTKNLKEISNQIEFKLNQLSKNYKFKTYKYQLQISLENLKNEKMEIINNIAKKLSFANYTKETIYNILTKLIQVLGPLNIQEEFLISKIKSLNDTSGDDNCSDNLTNEEIKIIKQDIEILQKQFEGFEGLIKYNSNNVNNHILNGDLLNNQPVLGENLSSRNGNGNVRNEIRSSSKVNFNGNGQVVGSSDKNNAQANGDDTISDNSTTNNHATISGNGTTNGGGTK